MKKAILIITFSLCSMLSAQKLGTIDMDKTFVE